MIKAIAIFLLGGFILINKFPEILNTNEVVYINVENPILIKLNECLPEDIVVKVNLGTLSKRSDSLYMLIPNQLDEEIKVKVYYKKIVIGIKTFEVKNLPAPEIKLKHEKDNTLKVSQLKEPITLMMTYPSELDNLYKGEIMSFSITIMNEQGQMLMSTQSRNKILEGNIFKVTQNLKPGSNIHLSNFIIRSANGRTFSNGDFKNIKIVE